jgi:hypothetical protein
MTIMLQCRKNYNKTTSATHFNNAFSSSSSSMPNFLALHNPINLNSIQNIDNLNNWKTAKNVGFHNSS